MSTAISNHYRSLLVNLLRYSNRSLHCNDDKTTSTCSEIINGMVAMRRLSMNMITFAVGSVPILIVCIVALANLKDLSSLGEGCKSPCKAFLYSYLFIDVEILASIAAIVWILAMIVDPVINILADKKLRGLFLKQFPNFRFFHRSNEKITETTEVSDEKGDSASTNTIEIERF
uniref:G_PROTEIN_RECEP_F1_2 domain-containing protein n=2 Tax=Caenorhabditis tropicalis TaxID=1561998 RepID=A0A1I7U385_9PELO